MKKENIFPSNFSAGASTARYFKAGGATAAPTVICKLIFLLLLLLSPVYNAIFTSACNTSTAARTFTSLRLLFKPQAG